MTNLDLFIIAAYALGMLAVGRYYSTRTADTEQYLLGGRTMNPFMIGLSLFATLTSSLSYLALPGELIGHGPMIFAQLASYPIVAFVVGWLLIPAFMKLKVTSAYELLESQLGISGRLLGATMFVVLRLVWMSAILYATADIVLAPLLGLQDSTIPYVCAAMGLITVVYTTEGGMRAVVITDAMQSFIMLFGTIVCVGAISFQLGGWNAWWPTTWYSHWDQPVLWDSTVAHIPVAGAFANMLTWMICTAGSDQMAVQRYLATRDAQSARRSFNISLLADVIVQIMLALAALGVLAYFTAHPEQLSAGKNLVESADQMFPRFILIGLPSGLTGLLIAAILSAAMSSLSSGVNSSCAVILTDFIGRFRRDALLPAQSVRLARGTSAVIGTLMVSLSMLLGYVPGNLLEKCFKAVNLFVAPLFVLFFLAMFVPWSTPLGAFLATAASIAVAVGVSFLGWFGVGFLWMLPCSLATGILVGALASPLFRRNQKLAA